MIRIKNWSLTPKTKVKDIGYKLWVVVRGPSISLSLNDVFPINFNLGLRLVVHDEQKQAYQWLYNIQWSLKNLEIDLTPKVKVIGY